MSTEKIAERYALGLIEALKADKATDSAFISTGENLKSLCDALEEGELRQVLYSPAIDNAVKTKVLLSVLKQLETVPVLDNFLQLLIKKGRFNHLPVITESFEKHLKNLSGMTSAELVSASAIEDSHLQEIKGFLESKLGSKLELELKIEPEIMGGFIVKMGNRILDFSLKTKLEKLTNAALVES